MTNTLIANEFTSSMTKAITKLAQEEKCEEEMLQVALELNSNKENVYKVCKNFAVRRLVKLSDILFLNPLYGMFKGKISEQINKSLVNLRKQEDCDAVTVFIMKSKQPGKLRIMLYVKGQYKQELTTETIASLN